MAKKSMFLVGMIFVFLMAGCDSSDVGEIPGDDQKEINIQKAEESEVEFSGAPIELKNGTILQKVKAREMGLEKVNSSAIPLDDFQSDIVDMIQNLEFTEEDKDLMYNQGLVVCNKEMLLITEHYTKAFMKQFSIGDTVSDFIEAYGEPISKIDNILFYKTENLYFAIRGKETIEQVIFKWVETDGMGAGLLLQILKDLNQEEAVKLKDLVEGSAAYRVLFPAVTATLSSYAVAYDRGIEIVESEELRQITVFNNFSGDMYEIIDNKGSFTLVYENLDFHIEQIMLYLQNYIQINDNLLLNGNSSPDGSRMFVYETDALENTYFRIRDLSYQRRDAKIASLSEVAEAYWLTNQFILYVDAVHQIPLVVSLDAEPITQNVLYEIGLIDKADNLYPEGYMCSVVGVNESIVSIKNNFNGEIIYFSYKLDEAGKLVFTRQIPPPVE